MPLSMFLCTEVVCAIDFRHLYPMNILLIGAGGREHALAWKMKQSNLCGKLFIAPGNAGTSQCGTNVDISVSDFEEQKKFCLQNNIDMVVVGPEEPLVKGICDFFKSEPSLAHIRVIGPSAQAAKLEGSKAFAKAFMNKYGVPTAAYFQFTANEYETGRNYLEMHKLPIVLKADGLAAGKGVVICETHEHALEVFEEMLIGKQFGEASSRVVVEQFLKGIELSVFVVTDGKNFKVIGEAKDYKRIGEGDTGLNTGGMGCISPVPFADAPFMNKVIKKVIEPTIAGLTAEKMDYKGFLFFGLINVNNEPYVIEYNCRMGDPETEVVMPRLQNDVLELFNSLFDGNLEDLEIRYNEGAFATVMAVSGGYPGDYKKGIVIQGLESAGEGEYAFVFHAGTATRGNNTVTNGGRVLATTAKGETVSDAVEKALTAVRKIDFEGIYYRKDIGYEFVSASATTI